MFEFVLSSNYTGRSYSGNTLDFGSRDGSSILSRPAKEIHNKASREGLEHFQHCRSAYNVLHND